LSKDNADKKSNIYALRAKDIIPPYNNKNHQEQMPPTKENSPNADDNIGQKERLPTKQDNTVFQKAAIPKFDLAKQIMSEQRKVASIKRKAPDKKNNVNNYKQKAYSIGYAVKPPSMSLYQEQIIAEIVQRDIQRLKKR